MRDFEFTLDLGELARGLDVTREQMRAAAESAAFEECEAIMSDSKENYVPVDEGILRSSGHVVQPEWQGDALIVVLGYGGDAAAYAIAVHEHLSDHSPRSWKVAEAAGRPVRFTVGGAKFLELPMMHAEADLPARLGARIRGKLGG